MRKLPERKEKMENGKALAEKEIDVTKLQEMETAELVEFAAAKDRKVNETKVELDILKAELQRRAENELEERNVKFTEFFGKVNSYVNVSCAQKLEILNMPMLGKLLGEGLLRDKVMEKPQEVKYELEKKFKQALTAVITGDYDNEFTVEQVVDSAGWPMDAKQRSLILKKLKGEYARDIAMLRKTLGCPELEADVELYYIYKIKSWELVRAFFPEKDFAGLAGELKKYVIVDETPRIELKYSREAVKDGIKGDTGAA